VWRCNIIICIIIKPWKRLYCTANPQTMALGSCCTGTTRFGVVFVCASPPPFAPPSTVANICAPHRLTLSLTPSLSLVYFWHRTYIVSAWRMCGLVLHWRRRPRASDCLCTRTISQISCTRIVACVSVWYDKTDDGVDGGAGERVTRVVPTTATGWWPTLTEQNRNRDNIINTTIMIITKWRAYCT